MDQETRHVMRGYFDLFLTMGPAAAKEWIDRIDALPHDDKCGVLEEFEWAKERFPHYRRTRQYLWDRPVRELLYSLLRQYWELRRSYDGGYYYRYLPEPLPDESPLHYSRRVGTCVRLLRDQYVRMYQREPFVDLRFALMMLLPDERDRICRLTERVSAREAAKMREYWPETVNLWLLYVSAHPPIVLDTFDATRQALDNFVFSGILNSKL